MSIRINLQCSECNIELEGTFLQSFLAGEIGIAIKPCDCNKGESENVVDDCSQCEDVKKWLKRAVLAEKKLATITELCKQSKMPIQPTEAVVQEIENATLPAIDKTMDEHDCNCQSSIGREVVHSPDCPLHKNTKILQPTDDIRQGNTIIPGIRKNSAQGVKASYGDL